MESFSSFDGIIIDFTKQVGYSLRLTEVVQEACAKRELQDVLRKQYSVDAKPELAQNMLLWFKKSMHFLAPVV